VFESLTCITAEWLMYTVYNTMMPLGDDGGLHFISIAYGLTAVTATLSGALEGTVVEKRKKKDTPGNCTIYYTYSSVYHLPVWSQYHRLDWIIL